LRYHNRHMETAGKATNGWATTSLARLEITIILLVLGMVASWELLVPHWIALPDETVARLRGYPLLLVPVGVLLLLGNHLWLRPLFGRFEKLRRVSCPVEEARELLSRAIRYPYLVLTVTVLVLILMSVTVALVQIRRTPTPGRVVFLLVLLSSSHGLVLATLLFGVCRRAMRPFLILPAGLVAALPREPDLFWRLAVGLVGTVSAAWLTVGTVSLGNLHAASSVVQKYTGNSLVAGGILALDLGWVFLALGTLAVAFHLARDARQHIRRIARELEVISHVEQAASLGGMAVTSNDELGELAADFNRLARHLVEQTLVLRQAAIEAERAESHQVEFLTAISHDLRTPLHSITGFAQLLAEDEQLSDSQRADVAIILRSAHHLLGLVDDIVDLTKIESGLLALERRPLDLQRVLHEAIDAARLPSGPEQPIELQLPEHLPPVLADESRLRQIMINLISNAIKYAGPEPITVAVELKSDRQVEVQVIDNGPGLPPEYLERIFDEYERASAGQETSGTGLGLAITRRLVELHGGSIRAWNRPGKGAVFAFTLPLASEAVAS